MISKILYCSKKLILLPIVVLSANLHGNLDFLQDLYYDSSKTYSAGESVVLSSDPTEIYTAIDFVPAGNPPPNSLYWSDSGGYTNDLTENNSGDLSTVPSSSIDTEGIPGTTPSSDPSFPEGNVSVDFPENDDSDVYIASASFTDTYTLSSEKDGALFDLNETTGVLSFKVSPDYEDPQDEDTNNTYEVVILAASNTSSNPDSLSLSVNVTNVPETPVFSNGTSASVDFMSGTTGIVYTATATDNATFSLSGTDYLLFVINSATGDLTFYSTPDYNNPADSNSDNVYDIVIEAKNDSGSAFSALSITIEDVSTSFTPGFRRDGTPMDPSIPAHFDVDGYYDRNNDVRDLLANQPDDGVLAYDHYINFGITEDRMFDNYFVPLEYLSINQDLRVVFTDDDGNTDLVGAVDHWFNNGMNEGRLGRFAMPDWFDAQQYMDNHNDVRDALDDDSPFGKETEAWWHFYRIGAPQENRSWNDEEFTLDAYIALNQDVSVVFKREDETMDKKAAMYHYIYAGFGEGRVDTFSVPSWFDSNEYLDANPDIASSDWGTSEFKSFNHFFRFGAPNDNRSISTFNLDTYIANNQDVVLSSNNDRAQILIHYIAYGFIEGRIAF